MRENTFVLFTLKLVTPEINVSGTLILLLLIYSNCKSRVRLSERKEQCKDCLFVVAKEIRIQISKGPIRNVLSFLLLLSILHHLRVVE